ncbi:hypothetical protein MMC07_009376 [Pseudocyphellaria aurata]|nr:hypothetical protein [Pseudocyphellaria aurata]
MSTAKRRRGHSLHLDLPNRFSDESPPVAALFLIRFDVKAGYTIAWKRSIAGLDLAESVEFKSLPSGLHNVQEDLIYFVHEDDYAGISAFINEPAAKSERNALMLAVGVLVPLSHGRLGKSWKHASALKELATSLVQDPSNTQPLEDFWTAHQPRTDDESADSESHATSPSVDRVQRRPSKPNGQARTRNRAISTASALAPPGQSLSPHHPALSLPTFLDTFGPLIFPLYKAALLRKRILLVGQAPVELACNFVYNISILSGIPASVADLLPLEPLPARLRPYFSVGVHDMQTLAQGSRNNSKTNGNLVDDGMGYGWVACSTDDILATKEDLYDTLIIIPPPYTAQAAEKVWPRVSAKRGTDVKATQRDLRRYRTLRRELHRYPSRSRAQSPVALDSTITHHAEPQGNTPLLPIENTQETFDDASSTTATYLTEPQSWSALAYSSFMWWASAGEKRSDLEEEAEHDSALLRDFGQPHNGSPRRSRPGSRISPGVLREHQDAPTKMVEMAIIAYFHRLTALMLGNLSRVVDASDDGADSGDEGEGQAAEPPGGRERDPRAVFVASEDMARMGLDVWSEADRRFVKELIEFYWGRTAEVQGVRVECCGVRIF